jgi:hypothetical protein
MPNQHQDKSTRLNLERNLRRARRRKSAADLGSEYSVAADARLEFEADKSGMIHTRKNPGTTEVLAGYGTTNFGVSPFLPEAIRPMNRSLLGLGLAGAGVIVFRFRDVLTNYALLWREYVIDVIDDRLSYRFRS